MDRIRINQGRIVSLQFRLGGTLAVLMIMAAGLLYLGELQAVLISIFISFLIPPLWSSYDLLEIDPKKKNITEITWIAGYTLKKIRPYDAIVKIFINQSTNSQQMTSYGGQVHTKRSREYLAFLKFADGSTYFLVSDRNPENLFTILQAIAEKLKCPLVKNFEQTSS